MSTHFEALPLAYSGMQKNVESELGKVKKLDNKFLGRGKEGCSGP
jgi:hypothetical protein